MGWKYLALSICVFEQDFPRIDTINHPLRLNVLSSPSHFLFFVGLSFPIGSRPVNDDVGDGRIILVDWRTKPRRNGPADTPTRRTHKKLKYWPRRYTRKEEYIGSKELG